MADVNITPMTQIDNAVRLPAGSVDMFQRMQQLADIQNAQNQNKLFQQTFGAKQRAGQIMASAPDVQTGLQRLQADPLTAAYAPELMNNYRQLDLTNTQVGAQQQDMYQHGLAGLLKALPSSYVDQGTFASNLATQYKALSPATQQYFRDNDIGGSITSALYDGLPTGTDDASRAQASAMFKQRLNAMLLGANFDPAAIQQAIGKPGIIDTKGAQTPGITNQVTGQFAPSQAPITTGIAPIETNIHGTPVIVPGNPFGPTVGPQAAPTGTNPLGFQGAATAPSAQTNVNTTPAPAGSTRLAGDGQPLIGPTDAGGISAPGPSVSNPLGMQVLSDTQQTQADELMKEYTSGGGRKQYDQAQATMGSLAVMDNSFDALQKAGGIMTPGLTGTFRGQIANLVDTMATITGKKPPVDPNSVASFQDLVKTTRLMGLQVLTSMLGNQREAAQTISNITEAVPGMENTYLGGKSLIAIIRGQAQRVIDERAFDNAWINQHQGNLSGADVAFNEQHPATGYVAKALAGFGMKADGTFQSPEALRAQVQSGNLTPQQAAQIAKKQFGSKPPAAAPAPRRMAPAANTGAFTNPGATSLGDNALISGVQ